MKWQSVKLRQKETGIDCILYLLFITYQLDDMHMKSYVSLEVSGVVYSLDIDILNNTDIYFWIVCQGFDCLLVSLMTLFCSNTAWEEEK